MFKSKVLPILAGAAAFALMVPVAHANVALPTFNLTIANANLATQGSGPYASVSITGIGSGTSSSSTFNEFEVMATGLNSFVFGDSNIFNLNLSTGAGGAGAGTLCLTNGGNCTTGAPSPSDLSQTAAGNADGFGSFDFSLNDGAGFSPGAIASSLTFDFTTANLVTVANLLATNGTATAAAHMALGSNLNCTGFAGNGGTQGMGTVDNSSCVAVPAPVIGHGLLVLLAIGGVLFGGKALESYKKHRLQAA
jgi:hypothetical protein